MESGYPCRAFGLEERAKEMVAAGKMCGEHAECCDGKGFCGMNIRGVSRCRRELESAPIFQNGHGCIATIDADDAAAWMRACAAKVNTLHGRAR